MNGPLVHVRYGHQFVCSMQKVPLCNGNVLNEIRGDHDSETTGLHNACDYKRILRAA